MIFGIDYVEYDDSYFPTFLNYNRLEMLNFKQKIESFVSSTDIINEGPKPFLIFEFNLENEGQYAERRAFNIIHILKSVGGL